MASSDFPLTARQWAAAQREGGALQRLLSTRDAQKTDDPAWISIASRHDIEAQLAAAERLRDAGAAVPLFGVPVAVKDNIDVAGMATTAACASFAYTASADAGVVRQLKQAGAVVMGKCNLDQFATGLVGVRSPYGVVPNTFDGSFVCGGSSSGSASVVARGVVPLALGTDTAGSGRVPAGFNNLVGLKPTRGALSTAGVVPACRTLDCVSIFALNLDDACLAYDVLAQYDPDDAFSRRLPPPPPAPAATLRIAVDSNPQWHGDAAQEAAYHAALASATELGWELMPIDFTPLFDVAHLLYDGPWVAERYTVVHQYLDSGMDPTVRAVVARARDFTAAHVFDAEYRRHELARAVELAFGAFDALLVPTTPLFPTIAQVHAAPVAQNSLLGTYTNFVNLLDWSALAFPAGFRKDGLPFGLTLISLPWQEKRLAAIAHQWLSRAPRRLGATACVADEPAPAGPVRPSTHALAVVGAHLSGLPLNHQLVDIGATLLSATTTSAAYHLYELPGVGSVRKPGLVRVGRDQGAEVAVEIWDVPEGKLGSFIASVPFPLSIGRIELADGEWVMGFLAQSDGLANALDITSYGGWKAYLEEKTPAFKSVLIANRGEIAVRISATLKRLGIRSVAIYSEDDKDSRHVRDADEAFPLHGQTLADTYLCSEQIIAIAKRAGAEAVIPGYGMLSENADFAAACEAAGLAWIGPTPEQISVLGLKHMARELAEKASVPLLPGSGLVRDAASAVAEAEKIGFPVILKSTGGGGGVGLERCHSADQVLAAFDSVRRLSETFFANEGVFVEKFVQKARHIEVQIVGDGNGNVRHISERDCSLQRRHQKVVEESPALLVPDTVRAQMRSAATRFASAVSYRNVGTIEFLYDPDTTGFYFLEANTRLQVEHPVTEAITGLDLVEVMVVVAAGRPVDLFDRDEVTPHGASLEARIYAESPLQGFRPSPGVLVDVEFPDDVRVDTWVEKGTRVSASFDPLLAKIIVHAETRALAIEKLCDALDRTSIYGIETNVEYLRHVCRAEAFTSGEYTTSFLNHFEFHPTAFEVLAPGSLTTVQDYPGRLGYWHVGIPPSGPMDSYGFRVANRIVGNDEGAAGLECAAQGPRLLFHHAATIAVAGSPCNFTVNGVDAPLIVPVQVSAGDTVDLGRAEGGARMYLAVKGGIAVPKTFGSRSTFLLGKMGGHLGRQLRAGDILPFDPPTGVVDSFREAKDVFPDFSGTWQLRVIPGPHGFPDYFQEQSFKDLFLCDDWKVHYNSTRSGVRLVGPRPEWARESGGTAGLHPSNIHDGPYSIGTISFTGDEAIILTCDGPSLGGFVCFATVITADLWKLGQVKPGDRIRLCPVSVKQALEAGDALVESVQSLSRLHTDYTPSELSEPIILDVGSGDDRRVYRQAGDAALLLELGNGEFDIRCSQRLFAIIQRHRDHLLPGTLEITPGVRSLHIQYDSRHFTPQAIAATIEAHCALTTTTITSSSPPPLLIPSRIVRLPIAFDDPAVLAATDRYARTIRASAPYLPSNASFLQRLNGLPDTISLRRLFCDTDYLVLGLGDVFCGSPCAVPLDPRRRLHRGTKYSPPRSFTPEGTVGLGGQYLCVYAVDSPGGYQMLGRTVRVWRGLDDDIKRGRRPWLFDMFDRIRFYEVDSAVLQAARDGGDEASLVEIEEGGVLDVGEYEEWLADNAEDIERVAGERAGLVDEGLEKEMEEFLLLNGGIGGGNSGSDDGRLERQSDAEWGGDGGPVPVQSPVAGKCWKWLVDEASAVKAGDAIVRLPLSLTLCLNEM
ncbi:Urea amidolyase [Lasiodiplodia theobromae]|uniref:Urea amidolyase n=1 Tax=Lasiodiplodia theobromae TaxID=45133 RepID=A0A5N5D3V5_9PEZI|nr:Urea amidolyase [Lasiodiplodia theobromae]